MRSSCVARVRLAIAIQPVIAACLCGCPVGIPGYLSGRYTTSLPMRFTDFSAGSFPLRRRLCGLALSFALLFSFNARGEAMLQLFNVNWNELATRMPEIAEAGYTSLWLPPPAKAGSVFSVGYDLFDPFDLGDINQRGTVRTRYGTKVELQQVMEMAHRFGLRVYFDNIMNHRGFDIPGYNSSTPTNLYPGLAPQDFHLRKQADGTYRNWDNISDYGNLWQVQQRPLFGLIDLANESGSQNLNFGATEGSTAPKISFLRQPGSFSYYMDTNLSAIAGPWRPFNGANGDPVLEDVNAYLIRAAMWMMAETRCDGFRFDAVKHTPSTFFGDTSATTSGYVGGIQTIYDFVHGYGNNVTGNGYVESDDNRNSNFDSEITRNDALLFGEHLGEPPSYAEYFQRGMRLVDSPLHSTLNNILGNPSASLIGLDQRDSGGFSAPNRVMYAQSHDNAFANHRELQLAFMFMREGIPVIYSDGYNQSSGPDFFPRVANAPYLGQFGDNKMPDLAYLHQQLARGGTRGRWSDADIVAFERYDYRDGGSAADQTVVLFAMNDNYAGDISFDDGVAQAGAGTFYECFPVNNSRGVGLAVSFPPGSVLYQLADSPNKNSACSKLLVRNATSLLATAQATANDGDPVNRAVYVGGQTIPPGGGAIELKIPTGSYVAYAYQWPEASRAALKDAITFQQGGADAPRITVYRKDGVNGDASFAPTYPFKMRGSIDPNGNLVSGGNFSNKTYAIEVPILTNAPFDLVFRTDASAVNVLAKLDGGFDLNSHLLLGPTNGFDRRDNKPGATSDIFLGYEQAMFRSRSGPEKFAAQATNRNNTVSAGAETYHYTVGGANLIVNGAGSDWTITVGTAAWAIHNPTNGITAAGAPGTQRNPANPAPDLPVEIYVRAGFEFNVNRCVVYYTTDGNNPEGSFGVGKGTTQVVEAGFFDNDTIDGTIDWWVATIPGSVNTNGAQIRYKVALFKDNSGTISDALDAKRFGLTTFAITNFNPTTATVWLHNNLKTNDTTTGLSEGFHIVRARAFLPRDGKSAVYNTFLQTFYYDAAPPTGAIAFPSADGSSISNGTYSVVVRTDSSVTGAEFNIQDSDANNDDALTGQNNANGNTNSVAKFLGAIKVTPNDTISALFPNLPQEWRFNYALVPSGGSATITVRLRETTTSLFTNRLTTLTRTVNTFAPQAVMNISAPAVEGSIIVLSATASNLMQACFSTYLTNDPALYRIYTNGVLVPRTNNNYIFLASGCSPGLRSLYYYWVAPPAGTNTYQVTYSNIFTLSDTRTFVVARPGDSDGDGMSDYNEVLAGTDSQDAASALRITELANGNQLVVWDSVAGRNYQVLATTNLFYPMEVISPVIQASGPDSFYFDSAPDAVGKFYRIQLLP
jgi:glycosidase